MAYSMSDKVDKLSGIGPAKAKRLAKLGIYTVSDLVHHFPRAYENRGKISSLINADPTYASAFLLTVATEVRTTTIRRGLTISKLRAFDDTASVEITFFNSVFVKDIFHIGSTFRFFGKVEKKGRSLYLSNPKYEPFVPGIPLADFIPIYPLTEGLNSKFFEKQIFAVLSDAISEIKDPLPEDIRLKEELATYTYALKNIHSPTDENSLSLALRRLAFDELFLFGLGISLSAIYKSRKDGIPLSPCSLKPLVELLPYELTADQKNAINDIYKDTVGSDNSPCSPMARILVGDVGSGKTVCAIAALYIAAKSCKQSALMVPTEILARQHYEEISALFGRLGINVALLTGSTTQKNKSAIYEGLASGEIDVVVGTHALISDKTEFKNLALVVTDEQHRFGVTQRAMLREKGALVHLLVMSATPIPRTLALALYGDLDVSRIVEMPKGRMKIDTYVVDESYRDRLNAFMEKQVQLGGQCYVVCPAIEGEADDECEEYIPSITAEKEEFRPPLKNALDYCKALKEALPNISIEYLHGKMNARDKDAVMKRFSSGEVKIIVSTTVIEVGVNVPNATLMVVENAERFGLSQLHQLRGRVGRGKKKSYCILVSDSKGERARDRLEVMRTTHDGFKIAEKDLILRGPGDFFSKTNDNLRQSGGFDFKIAHLCQDNSIMERAFATAKSIAESDPELTSLKHAALKARLNEFIIPKSSTIS